MDKVTDGVIFSSNLAVLFDNEDDEPDAEDDSLIVTTNKLNGYYLKNSR